MPTAAWAAIALGSALVAAIAVLTALRGRALLRTERLAARVARERALAYADSVRALGAAALVSLDEVRAEIDRAVRRSAPGIDSVLLFDEDEADLRCTFARGARVAYFEGARIARVDATALPAMALRAGRRVTLDDGARGFHPADVFAIAVPLAGRDGRASVLVASATSAVDGPAAEALVSLADQIAFTYAFALEREADRRRAEFDGLTGLLTPRAFRERLADLAERARLAPTARFALLFVDTDRFKAWNDTYGHASGDALLRAIARVLAAAAGPDDLAARNGGDEFCLVFTDTEKSAAIARAQAVRAAIAAIDFAPLRPAGTSADVRVTASIGVAAYPADATSAHALLERADAAMYETKRGGRDGVSYVAVDGAIVRADAPAVATP